MGAVATLRATVVVSLAVLLIAVATAAQSGTGIPERLAFDPESEITEGGGVFDGSLSVVIAVLDAFSNVVTAGVTGIASASANALLLAEASPVNGRFFFTLTLPSPTTITFQWRALSLRSGPITFPTLSFTNLTGWPSSLPSGGLLPPLTIAINTTKPGIVVSAFFNSLPVASQEAVQGIASFPALRVEGDGVSHLSFSTPWGAAITSPPVRIEQSSLNIIIPEIRVGYNQTLPAVTVEMRDWVPRYAGMFEVRCKASCACFHGTPVLAVVDGRAVFTDVSLAEHGRVHLLCHLQPATTLPPSSSVTVGKWVASPAIEVVPVSPHTLRAFYLLGNEHVALDVFPAHPVPPVVVEVLSSTGQIDRTSTISMTAVPSRGVLQCNEGRSVQGVSRFTSLVFTGGGGRGEVDIVFLAATLTSNPVKVVFRPPPSLPADELPPCHSTRLWLSNLPSPALVGWVRDRGIIDTTCLPPTFLPYPPPGVIPPQTIEAILASSLTMNDSNWVALAPTPSYPTLLEANDTGWVRIWVRDVVSNIPRCVMFPLLVGDPPPPPQRPVFDVPLTAQLPGGAEEGGTRVVNATVVFTTSPAHLSAEPFDVHVVDALYRERHTDEVVQWVCSAMANATVGRGGSEPESVREQRLREEFERCAARLALQCTITHLSPNPLIYSGNVARVDGRVATFRSFRFEIQGEIAPYAQYLGRDMGLTLTSSLRIVFGGEWELLLGTGQWSVLDGTTPSTQRPAELGTAPFSFAPSNITVRVRRGSELIVIGAYPETTSRSMVVREADVGEGRVYLTIKVYGGELADPLPDLPLFLAFQSSIANAKCIADSESSQTTLPDEDRGFAASYLPQTETSKWHVQRVNNTFMTMAIPANYSYDDVAVQRIAVYPSPGLLSTGLPPQRVIGDALEIHPSPSSRIRLGYYGQLMDFTPAMDEKYPWVTIDASNIRHTSVTLTIGLHAEQWRFSCDPTPLDGYFHSSFVETQEFWKSMKAQASLECIENKVVNRSRLVVQLDQRADYDLSLMLAIGTGSLPLGTSKVETVFFSEPSSPSLLFPPDAFVSCTPPPFAYLVFQVREKTNHDREVSTQWMWWSVHLLVAVTILLSVVALDPAHAASVPALAAAATTRTSSSNPLLPTHIGTALLWGISPGGDHPDQSIAQVAVFAAVALVALAVWKVVLPRSPTWHCNRHSCSGHAASSNTPCTGVGRRDMPKWYSKGRRVLQGVAVRVVLLCEIPMLATAFRTLWAEEPDVPSLCLSCAVAAAATVLMTKECVERCLRPWDCEDKADGKSAGCKMFQGFAWEARGWVLVEVLRIPMVGVLAPGRRGHPRGALPLISASAVMHVLLYCCLRPMKHRVQNASMAIRGVFDVCLVAGLLVADGDTESDHALPLLMAGSWGGLFAISVHGVAMVHIRESERRKRNYEEMVKEQECPPASPSRPVDR